MIKPSYAILYPEAVEDEHIKTGSNEPLLQYKNKSDSYNCLSPGPTL